LELVAMEERVPGLWGWGDNSRRQQERPQERELDSRTAWAVAILDQQDSAWEVRIIKEFRERGEAVVLAQVTVGGVPRQCYGSSRERGAAAFARATDDAVANIAQIFGASRKQSATGGPAAVPSASWPAQPSFGHLECLQMGPRHKSPSTPTHEPMFSIYTTSTEPAPHPKAAPVSNRRVKVLIVAPVESSVRAPLESLGFECTKVNGTEEALLIVNEQGSFDIVLLEGLDPRKEGAVTASKLRLWEAGHHVASNMVIVSATATDFGDVSYDGWLAGMDAVAPLPVEAELLATSLTRLMQEERSPSQSPRGGFMRDIAASYRIGVLHVYLEPLLDPVVAERMRPTIVLVDDEPLNTRLMSKVLKRYPAFQKLVTLHDGSELLPALIERDFEVDLILMDELMKTMPGSEATAQLRAYEREHNLAHKPVIAVTANVQSFGPDHFMNVGTDGVIMKPFDIFHVHSSLSRFITFVHTRASSKLLGNPPAEIGIVSVLATPPKRRGMATRASSTLKTLSALRGAA